MLLVCVLGRFFIYIYIYFWRRRLCRCCCCCDGGNSIFASQDVINQEINLAPAALRQRHKIRGIVLAHGMEKDFCLYFGLFDWIIFVLRQQPTARNLESNRSYSNQKNHTLALSNMTLTIQFRKKKNTESLKTCTTKTCLVRACRFVTVQPLAHDTAKS